MNQFKNVSCDPVCPGLYAPYLFKIKKHPKPQSKTKLYIAEEFPTVEGLQLVCWFVVGSHEKKSLTLNIHIMFKSPLSLGPLQRYIFHLIVD